MLPTLQRLDKTCLACPAQWEGELSDGTCVYIRYRFGVLGIGFGSSVDDAVSAVRHEWEIGDGLDGWMEWEVASPYFDEAVARHFGGNT